MPDRRRGGDPRWLDICRHRIRDEPAPFIVVLQHHLVPAASRIVAPLLLAGSTPATLLAPRIRAAGTLMRAMLLEMSAVPLSAIGDAVGSAEPESDAFIDALDAIFRGYPVGLPP